MKFWITYKKHFLITLCMLVIAACIPFDAYYHRQFGADELNIRPEASHMTELLEESATAVVSREDGSYQGIVAETDSVTLQRGDYTLQVVALSGEEHNTFEVYSTGKLNPDNTQGGLLTSATLLKEQEVTEIKFSIEESFEDISFRAVYGGEGELNVSGFYLYSAERMYTDKFCLMGGIFLVSMLVLLGKMWGIRLDAQGRQALLLLGMGVILVSLPLTFDFVLDGNDLYYQFNRVLGIQEGLKSGQFPVKIHSTMLHGYGYGSSIFYPELFLYFPALLGCMGMSLVNCYKTLIVLIHVATAGVAYLSFSRILKSRNMGLTGALLYTLSVYRLIDIYTRAAIGEALAMVFFPLVMWGLNELFLGDKRKWYLAALGFTGVIQSHVLSTELVLFFGAIFGICYIGRLREKGRIFSLVLSAGFTILMNLGVILPVLQHAAYPFRVFSVDSTLSWWTVTLPKVFDIILANPAERTYAGVQNSGEMPCSLGFVMLVGLIVFVCCYCREQKKEMILKNSMFILLLGAFGIYLSSNLFPWDKIQEVPFLYRLVTSIQIPWRFLALSSALFSLVCAVGFHRICQGEESCRAVLLGAWILAFLCAGVYINRYCEEGVIRYTQENQYQREQSQVDVLYFINVDHANSYRIWNRGNTFVPADGISLTDCYRMENLTAGFTWENFQETMLEESTWVDVPFTYYPNYKAFLPDGTELETRVGEQGVLRVELPLKETGKIEIAYREPWYYLVGRLAALLGFLGMSVMAGYKKGRIGIKKL